MTTKQEERIMEGIYTLSTNMWFLALLLSVQLSGWNSWESIWLTVGVGMGLVCTFIRHSRKAGRV